jgi:hypothetical protein
MGKVGVEFPLRGKPKEMEAKKRLKTGPFLHSRETQGNWVRVQCVYSDRIQPHGACPAARMAAAHSWQETPGWPLG